VGLGLANPTHRLGELQGAGTGDLLARADVASAPPDELEGEEPIQLAIIGRREMWASRVAQCDLPASPGDRVSSVSVAHPRHESTTTIEARREGNLENCLSSPKAGIRRSPQCLATACEYFA